MKIGSLDIHHAPDEVLSDLTFDIAGDLHRPNSRIDRLVDALLDCVRHLDRGHSHTFHDPASDAYIRVERLDKNVKVQSQGSPFLPDGTQEQTYAEFRADVLDALHQYRDRLLATVPEHPETRRFLARLEVIAPV